MIINGFCCEGPKCEERNGKRIVVQWNPDEAKANPESVPDAFYRFGNWQPIYEEPKPGRSEQPLVRNFCSTQCTIDYLRHVETPRSPREQAAIAENNKQVELKKLEKEQKKEEYKPGYEGKVFVGDGQV